jgi:hypothetical protein
MEHPLKFRGGLQPRGVAGGELEPTALVSDGDDAKGLALTERAEIATGCAAGGRGAFDALGVTRTPNRRHLSGFTSGHRLRNTPRPSP